MKRTAGLLAAVAFAVAGEGVAQERTGVVRVSVVPDSDDWTYEIGAPARFRVAVTRDGHALAGTSLQYACGPEMMPPAVEKAGAVSTDGLVLEGGTMKEPGFLRCVVTARVDGKRIQRGHRAQAAAAGGGDRPLHRPGADREGRSLDRGAGA